MTAATGCDVDDFIKSMADETRREILRQWYVWRIGETAQVMLGMAALAQVFVEAARGARAKVDRLQCKLWGTKLPAS